MAERRQRKRRQKPPSFQSFYLAVEDVEPEYMFAAGTDPPFGRPYAESVTLTLRGRFLSPSSLEGLDCRVQLLGYRELDQVLDGERKPDREPSGVGKLTIRKEQREYLGWLPQSALLTMMGQFQRGDLRIVHLHGHTLKYGSAMISTIMFFREVDPDDLI